MNIRELIDTVEAKCGLLASQHEHDAGVVAHRQIQGHLDDVRDALGLPCGEASCCGCGHKPFLRCPDCSGQFCEHCGDVLDGEFVCDVCREEREATAQEGDGVDVDAGGDSGGTTPTYHVAGAGATA